MSQQWRDLWRNRHHNGAEWEQIANELGTTRQAAQQQAQRTIRRLWRDKKLREKFLCRTT